jgi:dTDP-4-dehydrorhamnose reductase
MAPRILVTGASGQLGSYLLWAGREQGLPLTAWSGTRTGQLLGVPLQPVSLTDRDALIAAFRAARPSTVIHAAARSLVSECHRHPEEARKINIEGTRLLAELAAEAQVRFLFVSTDMVFDGERGWYREEDALAPLSVYGRSKAEAEQAVLSHGGTVVRVSLLFGPSLGGRPAFFDAQVNALRLGQPCTLFADEWRTPLALTTAAQALLSIVRSECTGILHLGGPERMSRLEMGQRLAAFLGFDASSIVPAARSSASAPEPRPRDISLDSARWRGLFPNLAWPGWEDALKQMISLPAR